MAKYDLTFRGKVISVPGPLALARAGLDGANWYQIAHTEVAAYAASIGEDPHRVASILSVLSPRVTVTRNVSITRNYFENDGDLTGVMYSPRAAVAHYELTGEIRGPKTRSFRDAIMGDDNAVVVDAWMARAFQQEKITPKTYRKIAASTRRLATILGESPANTQAAIWAGVRALFGFRPVDLVFTKEVATV